MRSGEKRAIGTDDASECQAGVGTHAGLKGGQLSGDERQMLAIGIGLIASPRLAMFDEPSGGLAPMLVHAVFDAIKVIVRKFDTSVLVVEQNIDIACKIPIPTNRLPEL
jgi:branched-chain amino acid transport system ATP-binding protein